MRVASCPHLIAVCLAGCLGLVPEPAAAFPRDGTPSSKCGPLVTYRFKGKDWTSALKTTVRNAVDDWNVPDDFDGSALVTVRPRRAGETAEIFIDWVSNPGGTSALGYGACEDESSGGVGGYRIELNASLKNADPNLLAQVARHEMGHVLGFRHTGKFDDYTVSATNPTTIPTMYACPDSHSEAATARLRQDDEGQLAFRYSSLSVKPIHPNGSFENPSTRQYWGRAGGSWFTSSSNSEDGTYHLAWKASTNSNYVFMTENYTVGGNLYDPNDRARVDARINVRKNSSTDRGGYALELWARPKYYADAPICDVFPTGLDENSYTWGLFTRVATTWFVGTSTSWVIDDTPIYTVPSSYDAVDLQIRVRSSALTSSGDRAYLRIDNTRARDRS